MTKHDPRAADRAEDAAQLLQRLDQHGGLVTLSADAASVIRALLTDRQSLMERVTEAENEGLLLRQLSDALTGGNAGTWDEIIHAAVSLRAELEALRDAIAPCRRTPEDAELWTEPQAFISEVRELRSLPEIVERIEREKAELREALETVLSLFDDPCPYDTNTTLAAARAALAASSPKEPSR